MISSSNNKVEIFDEYILMKSSGRECLTVYSKNINFTQCFNIYNTPKFMFLKNITIKIESNTIKHLYLNISDYPLPFNNYISNHPEIIKVDNKGKMTAIRPGHAIVTAFGQNNKLIKIKVISISTNGLLKKNTLDKYNASLYKKIMIVAHPDDETLWGGSNLFKDNYFVVCLTNGYNLDRANDFRKILKFTNNNGMILNYPDVEDNIVDDWSEVNIGIMKDLSIILSYKNWEKIVTHGPEGTTGHIHHKKISEYITKIAKNFNTINNLYYFGKFYKKNEIPKNLKRINDNELAYKLKEIAIYQSVKDMINKYWFHMIPYENLLSATNKKNFDNINCSNHSILINNNR